MNKVIMIVSNRYDPDIRVHKEAKYLISLGFDVEVLCWDRENDYLDRENEIIDGIRVNRFFPKSTYGSGIIQFAAFIKFIKEVKKYISNINYQYLYCHDLDGVITGYFAMKKKATVIFDMHEFYEINTNRKFARLFIRFIVNFFQNWSNYIVYVNKAQKTVINSKNKDKLIFLPNYPEKKHYINSEKSESSKLRISYIGAVRQFNEIMNLVEACREMEDVLISIHGSGIHFNKLKSLENEYSNLRVTGKYSLDEIPKLYSECDILYAVYPMNNLQNRIAEPVKFFEGIITKTPVMVDRRMMISEFIIEKNIGYVIEGCNIENIKKLVHSIHKNRKQYYEKVDNLNKIQYLYNWDEVVVGLDKIFKK